MPSRDLDWKQNFDLKTISYSSIHQALRLFPIRASAYVATAVQYRLPAKD